MTATSLGFGLAKQGKRVLLLDCDSQHSLTASVGVREIFVKNDNGMVTAKQGDEQAALAKSYWKTLPKNERGPAAWTLIELSKPNRRE